MMQLIHDFVCYSDAGCQFEVDKMNSPTGGGIFSRVALILVAEPSGNGSMLAVKVADGISILLM